MPRPRAAPAAKAVSVEAALKAVAASKRSPPVLCRAWPTVTLTCPASTAAYSRAVSPASSRRPRRAEVAARAAAKEAPAVLPEVEHQAEHPAELLPVVHPQPRQQADPVEALPAVVDLPEPAQPNKC